MSKIKVLWIGDGGVSTGFARVNHSIIENLPQNYEVHHLAVNYMGDPYPTKSNHFLYPAALGGDLLGLNRVQNLYEKIKPDFIFILNDPWVLNEYLFKIPNTAKVIAYTPVDAKPLLKAWVSNIKKISQLITYTEFGKSAYTDIDPEFTNIKVIPHGIDKKKFYPLDKLEARKTLNLKPDMFIFLNANRNQPRKRVDLTIKAFAEFCKDKPDAYLYLHMGVVDQGYDIIELSRRYGIEKRLIITSLYLSPANSVSDERLNIIYNACDVGINTSMGEGWGLVSVEHACTKRAQIVPDFSATSEIFSNNEALKVPVKETMPHVGIMTEGCVLHIDDIAQAMQTYYENRELMNQYAEAAYKKFTQPQYEWKNIAKEFVKVFEEVLNRDKK